MSAPIDLAARDAVGAGNDRGTETVTPREAPIRSEPQSTDDGDAKAAEKLRLPEKKEADMTIGEKEQQEEEEGTATTSSSSSSPAGVETHDHSKRRVPEPIRTPTDEQRRDQLSHQNDGTHHSLPHPHHPYGTTPTSASHPTSPSCQHLRSSSPRPLHSPASSQIFERDVQESTTLPSELSPAIPNHIQTEDMIPPVLEASSIAITDDDLSPDAVEIVMHSAHLPAAVPVAAGGGSDSGHGYGSSEEGLGHHHYHHHPHLSNIQEGENVHVTTTATAAATATTDPTASLDSHDVRRLSFISFADVVQGEHAEQAEYAETGGKDPTGLSSSALLSPTLSHSTTNNSTTTTSTLSDSYNNANHGGLARRSPSPVLGSQAGSFHHAMTNDSGRGVDVASGGGGGGGGMVGHGSSGAGDLTIETMRQALRRTGSGDLGGGTRSQPLSPVVGKEEGFGGGS